MWNIWHILGRLFGGGLAKPPKPKQKTLKELLDPAIGYDDLRRKLQAADYVNPHLSIPHRDVSKISKLVLHCTADDDMVGEDVWSLARYAVSPECHINAGIGCPCIPYHFLIEFVDGHCVVHRCLGHDVKAWHVGQWNSVSLGIAIDYDGHSELPMVKWQAAAKVMAWLCHGLGLPVDAVTFHRELEGTGWRRGGHGEKVYRKTCPGERLDLYRFRREVLGYLEQL